MNVDDWLSKNAPSMFLCGEFNGYKAKSTYKCRECGVETFVSMNSMKAWRSSVGCKNCSSHRKSLKVKKMKERLCSIMPNLEYLSDYVDCGKTATFKCKRHSIKIRASMQSIKLRNPCKKCRAEESRQKREQILISRLERDCQHVELIGKFIEARAEADFRCKIHDYKWSQKPKDVGKSHNCPVCGMSEYKTLYLMKDSNGMVKIGITKQGRKHNRALAVARAMGVKAVEINYFDIENAYMHEQHLLSIFDSLPYTKDNGRYWREFRELTDDQLSFAINYVKERCSGQNHITYPNQED